MSTEATATSTHSVENINQVIPSVALELALKECHDMIVSKSNSDTGILTRPKYFRGYTLTRLICRGKVDLALEMLALYPQGEIEIPNTTTDLYYFTIDNAARAHSLELLKLLHQRSLGLCSVNAMDTAATIGYLEMVRFLHENRTEGCSRRAFKMAKKFRHHKVLAYLEVNQTEGKKVKAPVRQSDVYSGVLLLSCSVQ
ncbi:hypothetical protein THRCLA_03453 [Thraustotheca clavata]|uniref:Uncharacterized protein n=1 Tax=Thraustotheca clavata TaxID=74557 RepID=A0A1W0A295_9STRA|nr:hypothetical protein THRCLA_03453 [Thraustotheca clavata]